jgi:hypothetical protein
MGSGLLLFNAEQTDVMFGTYEWSRPSDEYLTKVKEPIGSAVDKVNKPMLAGQMFVKTNTESTGVHTWVGEKPLVWLNKRECGCT